MDVYCHPNAKEEAMNILEKNIGHGKEIILGDFNAHHPEWSVGKKNKTGELLEELAGGNCLIPIGNKKHPTHYSKANESFGSPDVVFVKKSIEKRVERWQLGRDMGSDHLPIILIMDMEIIKYKMYRNKNWIYKKCKEEEYKEKLQKTRRG